MPALTESELKLKIKSETAGAFLLCGDETFLVRHYADLLMKNAAQGPFAEFNLRVFDCEEPDLSEIYEAAVAVPMMAENKCVAVKNYPVSKAGAGDMKALEKLLADNPPDNRLIFFYPTAQPKPSEIKTLTELFGKYGFAVKLSKLTASELVKTVERGAKKRGKSFEKSAAEYFVGNVGDDLNLLGNELEKLCAYSGEIITRRDVDAVCVKSLEANAIFMVIDLAKGNFEKAFHTLSELFELREDEYMILGAIIAQYAYIYRAKAAVTAGKSVGEIELSYESCKGRGKRLNGAAAIARSMSFSQITACVEILSQADIQMKSTQNDKRRILEETFVKLARVKLND